MPVHLSKAQVSKACSGHQIQLSAKQIGVTGHQIIHAHPETYKKLANSHRKGTGVRLHLTHHELAHGSGFLDFLKTIASPVLSGLQGVAKEIFPGSAKTIDSIRDTIRTATGYGIRKPLFVHGSGPQEKSDFVEGIIQKKKKGKKKHV